MKLRSIFFATAVIAFCLYAPKAIASSEADKIEGFYISKTSYLTSIVGTGEILPNEQALVFHHSGTMTRNDAAVYDGWGLQGQGKGGLKFGLPINGVWEVVKQKKGDKACKGGKKTIVRAVMFQYYATGDYPPPVTGLPGFFSVNSQSKIIRRCWEFEFSHLKDGKFQKCTGLWTSSASVSPNQDPLSTSIPQGNVTPGSASGPLPVFSRVHIEKTWFKGFPSTT